jgi:hypothetical protein
LTNFSENAQLHDLPPETRAMAAMVASLTCSALLMTSPHPTYLLTEGFEFLSQQIRFQGASIRCFVNPHKTRKLASCNGTSILLILAQHNPTLAESLSTSIENFSNKTIPNIPIELTTGADFASDFFDHQITDVKKNITSLIANISDQQTCLLLFSQCIIKQTTSPSLFGHTISFTP